MKPFIPIVGGIFSNSVVAVLWLSPLLMHYCVSTPYTMLMYSLQNEIQELLDYKVGTDLGTENLKIGKTKKQVELSWEKLSQC